MATEPGIAAAAQLFKLLGSESRLELMRLLTASPRTVGALAQATGLSQPLVSQHLRTLRDAGLVTVVRAGREATYEVADTHVTHVIADALAHAQEPDGTHAALEEGHDHEITTEKESA